MADSLFREHEPVPPPEKQSKLDKIILFFMEHPKIRKNVLLLIFALSVMLSLVYLRFFFQETIHLNEKIFTLVESKENYRRYERNTTWGDYAVTVEKLGEKVQLSYDLGQEEPLEFLLDAVYYLEEDGLVYYGGFEMAMELYEPTSRDHWNFIYNHSKIRGEPMFLLLAIIILCSWYVNLRFPLLNFHLNTFGMVENGTPSDLYYFFHDLGIWLILPLCFFATLYLGLLTNM